MKLFRTWACLLVLLAAGRHSALGQSRVFVGIADYRNRLFVSPPSATNAQLKAVTFLSGNVGSATNLNTPRSGNVVLKVSSFGQPVATAAFVAPDFFLGQQIIPPAGVVLTNAPTFDNPNRAFFVAGANQVYASEAGFVRITWTLTNGTFLVRTYFISEAPGATTTPQSVYWTDSTTPPNTGAPTIDLSGVNAVLHNNSSLPAASVFTVNNRLHARDNAGSMVLEFRDALSNSFLGVQIINVKPYVPDSISSANVGVFLSSSSPNTNHLAPVVSRGLANNPVHFAYQIAAGGDPHDGDVFATQPTLAPNGSQLVETNIEVFWMQSGFANVKWPYEMDRYKADWPTNFSQIAQRIYWTHRPDDSATRAPSVAIPDNVPNVVIHYNAKIPPDQPVNAIHSSFWQQSRALFAKQGYSGPLLIHYDNAGAAGFLGVEYVDVRPYARDFLDEVSVGDRLLPGNPANDPAPPDPLVTRGNQQNDPQNPDYVYQHTVSGSMKGALFATRTNRVDGQVEIFWRQHGLQGVMWPYEMHWYRASWPAGIPSKYQIYVRGTPPALGPDVAFPPALNATLMSSQEPAGNANPILNNSFTANGAGWSLIQSVLGDQVDFQVVRSVLHDDPAFFDLTPVNWEIGSEIADGYHQGPRPGFVYVPTVSPHAWDRYDWEIYDGKAGDPPEYLTKQIIPVNRGSSEVWWSNLKVNLGQITQWPSLVKRYNSDWPPLPDTIVIASGLGSGPISQFSNARLYYQNDSAKAGFNPNDEHAFIQDSTIFALRSDLGTNSDPYVLMKYQDVNSRWAYHLFKVVAEQAPYFFRYSITAPSLIEPPPPLNRLPFQYCLESYPDPGPWWRSREPRYYAKQGGDTGGTTNIAFHFFYELKDSFGFYFPDANLAGGGTSPSAHVAWLDRYAGTPGTPVRVTNTVSWPATASLSVGESLVGPKKFLPDISLQNSVEILYQQSQALSHGSNQSVKLIDPTRTRDVPLDALPADVRTISSGGVTYFPDLPPQLRSRLWYDPGMTPKKLRLKGQYVTPPAGEYYLLLNVLTARERDAALALSQNPTASFVGALNALTNLPLLEIAPNAPFTKPLAITAGAATGSGYVTLAFNNNTNLTDPISLAVINVTCPVYSGELKVIPSENPFDEKLTLRHSGDFAARAERYLFDWRVEDPVNGLPPVKSPDLWGNYTPTPPTGVGALDVTVGGAGIATLSDHYFVCRYRPLDPSNPCGTNWSAWTAPQLQEGWIKRVLDAINPFDQRNSDYANSQVNTIVSMIGQAGARFVGNVPLNQQAANSFGLIEIYESILRRGLALNSAGTPPGGYPPVNDALLLVAGKLADLYMLLGNEAFADAADPTIAYGTDDGQYGAVATSIHCFMNQTSSLLEEELALLRGRDDSLLPPVTTYPTYNRLIWNFTHDINGGEHAYALNYDIHDVTGPNGTPDGVIDAFDAKSMYPQGHGDAWGHYLTAIKNYYDLLRNPQFTWVPRIESVLVGGVPVSVDYLDERKFAQAAGAKARTGAEIINLTYRNAYVEDPQGQWQGYLDSNTNRAWGVAEWGSRAGQGAYFDWVAGNAMLPSTYAAGYKMTQFTLDQVGNASSYTLTDDAITNRIPRAAATIPSSLLSQLLAMPVRGFSGRSNFTANLDPIIGSANRQLFQGAILSSAQTTGLPEGPYELLDLLKGHIYATLPALESALISSNVLGAALFSQYYTNLIRPNLEAPSGTPVTGIQKIDRNSVTELRDVASAALNIQEQVDKADSGLNPLGLAKNAIPFDIDPTQISQGKTHFEQMYDRAVQALNNAIVVFNHANDTTQLLRRQADTLAQFQKTVDNQESDFTNRLIEIFGYPYPEDIGAGGSYPDGYQGPDTDTFHFNYIDSLDLTGVTPPTSSSTPQTFHTFTVQPDGSLSDRTVTVPLNISAEGLSFVKPTGWTHRRATGQIQKSLGDLVQARLKFESSLATYDNLIAQIEDQAALLQAQYNVNAAEINIINEGNSVQSSLNDQIASARARQLSLRTSARVATLVADAMAEMLPLSAGFSVDVTSTMRGAIKLAGSTVSEALSQDADSAELTELDYQQAKEESQALTNLRLTTLHQGLAIEQQLAQLEQLIRQEVLSRLDLFSQQQAMQQAADAYSSVLAQGQRLLEDRLRFRQQTAAQIQSDRYKDMAFRIFRNDALQKYRAQFDLAAAYVYLAARSYDYETNLRTNDNRGPGQKFMTDIIRSRSLGLIQNGFPIVGSGQGDAGLADPMARMSADWNLVLKGQLGFNNPETETGRFSLRSELCRVQTNSTTASANTAWRELLTRSVVTNLLAMPEFQRYCIPFTPSQPVEPAIVLSFSTTINFAQNFFGWPLGGGDNSYDSSHFATKIRSVGVWFANYNNTTLANQPRVYLVPIGSDVMTSPPRFPGDAPFTREWKILDQQLPVPFPLNDGDLSDATYIPINDSLIGDYGGIRKYASFRAYHDSGNFNAAETITASRLIGRSVWNNRWLLIIPAGTLLSDRDEAIQRFINGRLVNGVRDGNGVSDIKIFFQTYSYAGN